MLEKYGMKGANQGVLCLQGLALGNAWVDALTQMASIPNYAYAHGLIDGVTKEWLLDKWSACEDKFQQSKVWIKGNLFT